MIKSNVVVYIARLILNTDYCSGKLNARWRNRW